jgi:anaerobic selenocysteine-containing dehydrogenase
VEIYPTVLKEHGYNPLPTFVEPPESPIFLPSLAHEYPLTAIEFHVEHYIHSEFRDVPNLRKLDPEPSVEIHPKDAQCYGIADGDWVQVESLRGTAEMRAKVTEDIREGVVGMEVGWPGKGNANLLTSDEPRCRDPVTGGAMFRGYLCRVTKVSRS